MSEASATATGGEAQTTTTSEATEQTEQQKTTYSQADLDRAIAKAIKTREDNLKAKFEDDRLKDQGKFKEAAERAEARAVALELERDTHSMLNEVGLPTLAGVLTSDISTIDGRKKLASSIKTMIDTEVEKRVAEKLKTSKTTTSSSSTPKKPHEMSTDEYAAYKKQQGIF